jgi:hypothetical protein
LHPISRHSSSSVSSIQGDHINQQQLLDYVRSHGAVGINEEKESTVPSEKRQLKVEFPQSHSNSSQGSRQFTGAQTQRNWTRDHINPIQEIDANHSTINRELSMDSGQRSVRGIPLPDFFDFIRKRVISEDDKTPEKNRRPNSRGESETKNSDLLDFVIRKGSLGVPETDLMRSMSESNANSTSNKPSSSDVLHYVLSDDERGSKKEKFSITEKQILGGEVMNKGTVDIGKSKGTNGISVELKDPDQEIAKRDDGAWSVEEIGSDLLIYLRKHGAVGLGENTEEQQIHSMEGVKSTDLFDIVSNKRSALVRRECVRGDESRLSGLRSRRSSEPGPYTFGTSQFGQGLFHLPPKAVFAFEERKESYGVENELLSFVKGRGAIGLEDGEENGVQIDDWNDEVDDLTHTFDPGRKSCPPSPLSDRDEKELKKEINSIVVRKEGDLNGQTTESDSTSVGREFSDQLIELVKKGGAIGLAMSETEEREGNYIQPTTTTTSGDKRLRSLRRALSPQIGEHDRRQQENLRNEKIETKWMGTWRKKREISIIPQEQDQKKEEKKKIKKPKKGKENENL